MNFLQQALLHLGLWFRVLLVVVYLFMANGSRINALFCIKKKTGKMMKTQGNHGEFCLDRSVATLSEKYSSVSKTLLLASKTLSYGYSLTVHYVSKIDMHANIP